MNKELLCKTCKQIVDELPEILDTDKHPTKEEELAKREDCTTFYKY